MVTGIALRTTFKTFGIDLGLMTIIVGHATFCVVVAYNNVVARLRRLPRSPEEASADLGADTLDDLPAHHAARHAHGAAVGRAARVRPLVRRDHRHQLHRRRGHQTIPMWILTAIQRPTELPVVNVVALVLIVLSVIPVWLATRISEDGATAAATRLTSTPLPAPGVVQDRAEDREHRQRREGVEH